MFSQIDTCHDKRFNRDLTILLQQLIYPALPLFRLKAEKRLKDQQRKQRVTENRKHLANVRVVQKNLVFVVGLPMRLADADVSMVNNERSISDR